MPPAALQTIVPYWKRCWQEVAVQVSGPMGKPYRLGAAGRAPQDPAALEQLLTVVGVAFLGRGREPVLAVDAAKLGPDPAHRGADGVGEDRLDAGRRGPVDRPAFEILGAVAG